MIFFPGRPISLLSLGVALLLIWAGRTGAAESAADRVFAKVDGTIISSGEYKAVLRDRARQKFYHRKVPEAEMKAFRQEVGEFLIMRVLYEREANRRGLKPDEAAVEKELAKIVRRYSASPQWAKHKERILSETTRKLRAGSLVEILEKQIRQVAPPTEDELRTYYRKFPEKFTTPERIGVSVILLRVSPQATSEQWEEARVKLEGLRKQISKGEAFAKIARLHSQDPSADAGGELGFVHRDMLGSSAQIEIDKLSRNEVSGPVRLLDGFGLFRLNARQPRRLNPLDSVRDRARALWLRDARDTAWEAFGKKLRQAAVVELDERHYLAASGDQAAKDAGLGRSR